LKITSFFNVWNCIHISDDKKWCDWLERMCWKCMMVDDDCLGFIFKKIWVVVESFLHHFCLGMKGILLKMVWIFWFLNKVCFEKKAWVKNAEKAGSSLYKLFSHFAWFQLIWKLPLQISTLNFQVKWVQTFRMSLIISSFDYFGEGKVMVKEWFNRIKQHFKLFCHCF
jgi:hypothetical protein